MGVEKGYSFTIMNFLMEIDGLWKELLKINDNSQETNKGLVIISKKLEEMRKIYNDRKKEIRTILTQQSYPCPPKKFASSLNEVEEEICKVVLDKIRNSYPTNKKKVFQRELIKLKWSEETLEEFLNSEISIITSKENDGVKIKNGERIHHNVTSATLNNLEFQQKILKFTGMPLMPAFSQLFKPSALQILNQSQRFFKNGEYLLSTILLRLTLELCLYEVFEIEKNVEMLKLDWKGSPYFGEILKGIETIGISLPINRINLSNIYYFLSKSIHTGYREEFFVLSKIHSFTSKFIKTMFSLTYQNEKKQALVKWLDENSKFCFSRGKRKTK